MIGELFNPVLGLAEIGVNKLISMDPEALDQCSELQGRIIVIEIIDLNQMVYFHPGSWGLRLGLQNPSREPDAHIRGHLSGLVNLAAQSDKLATSIQERIEITGDARTAQKFQKILTELDIDWEEHLSRYVGDIAAFRIGEGLRQSRKWVEESLNSLGQSGREYLQEEVRHLPTKAEYEVFSEEVSDLRNTVDRLEALIDHRFGRRS